MRPSINTPTAPTAGNNRPIINNNNTGNYGGTSNNISMNNNNNQVQYQQQQQQQQRPQFSLSIWLLRNTLPVVPTSGYPIECAEPGDLLYGCENDLLDSGTKPLVWGPQPSLQHVANPKYFAGEALSALLVVRNTSATAAANNCKVQFELFESSQKKTSELVNVTIPSLVANGQSEFRVFTRIVDPGVYSLNAKVSCVVGGGGASVQQRPTDFSGSHGGNNNNFGVETASVTKSVPIELEKGIEEASRKIIQLPGKKGPGSAQFLVMFCLRNASKSHPAALQHVSLVSKDPAVTVSIKQQQQQQQQQQNSPSSSALVNSSKELLNAPDIHMTELLRVPVTTGSSSTDCVDSVMQAGEMRQFCWIVDVVAAASPPASSSSTDDGKKLLAASSNSSLSVSAAAALALLTNANPNNNNNNNSSSSPTAINQAPITIGVCEWQWRRAGGDGGAIRSSTITTTLVAPGNARGELAVESTGIIISSSSSGSESTSSTSSVIVGEPCALTYRITNRSIVPVDINAHIDTAALLPELLFVGGSSCIPLGVIEPQEQAELRIPVLPLQSGAFTTEAPFQLRDAAPPNYLPLWNGNINNIKKGGGIGFGSSGSNTQTNVVCIQAN